ncbi:hypothetical protein [Streptococcus anginosus]|uniref:hypothetical protein n=1 Tax=Streptococcus anginosus TaxID=1328 RepID=UPI0022E97820|nr:hypothetical protein [Streptococcus anginosus]
MINSKLLNELLDIFSQNHDENYEIQLVFDIVDKYSDEIISPNNFLEFCDYFSPLKDYGSIPILWISGSGRSGIVKPNIGTIASLYLTFFNYYVVKSGSKKRTSKCGSTDYINYLISSFGNEILPDNFSYIDVNSRIKWVKYTEILKLNNSIKALFEKYHVNFFKTDYKFTGSVDIDAVIDSYSKAQLNGPGKWFVYNSKIKNTIIDEFSIGTNRIVSNGDIDYHLKFSEENYEIPVIDDVIKINNDLLFGEYTGDFWLKSLELTVSIVLLLTNVVRSMDEGLNLFKNLYEKKPFKKFAESKKSS